MSNPEEEILFPTTIAAVADAEANGELDGDCGDVWCSQCGGDGQVSLAETPELWGEDCFCEQDRFVMCPLCRGEGMEL